MGCVNWCDYAAEFVKNDPDSQLPIWEISVATFSNWFNNEILGMLSGDAPTYKASGQYWIACCSTASTAGAVGTELSGNNYSRTAVTFERVSDIKRWNPTSVNSALASAAWDDILSFALFDQAEGGNYYAFGNLTTPLSIAQNNGVQWGVNKVVVSMASFT